MSENTAIKLVVADDDQDILRLAELCLSRDGHIIIPASNGADAYDSIVECKPHMALLDISMPKLSGIQVVEMIRDNPSTRSLPVIFFSTDPVSWHREAMDSNDVSAYIQKPFKSKRLREVVSDVINASDVG